MALDIHLTALDGAPLLSATVMLLRDAPEGLEVLMMRRHGDSADLGGVYVFPGGKLDPLDLGARAEWLDREASLLQAELAEPGLAVDTAVGLYLAALRETLEECGLLPGVVLADGVVAGLRQQLAAGQPLAACLWALGLRAPTTSLVPWSRWITPRLASVSRRRFDTRFFVARAPAGQQARHDDHEATEAVWLTPREALLRFWDGAIDLAPPQIMCLMELGQHGDVDAALRLARDRGPTLVQPEPFDDEGSRVICYPGDTRHSVRQPAWSGPTRLVHRNGRFEPEGGLAALLPRP
ncbi:NUDIX hydrolase [Hydrogenophaga sp. OTU3427]|uniref:NUDIX hydrolase n=1 Tax=Hydrogenophaga sp. OTU3427 TaxID=3043856 RepID=UPI00313B73A3